MMRALTILILVLMTSAPTWAQFDRRQRNREPDGLSSEYGALLENNIFLRDRGQRPLPPTSRPAVPPLTREQTLILTGIVLEEGQFRAYFEDTRGNSILRVAEGDPIASGNVGQIMIDAVAYETPDGMRWIDIGHDLTASIPDARATGLSTAPVAGSGTGGTAAPAAGGDSGSSTGPGDPALMSVEEQMRQRRLRTLGN